MSRVLLLAADKPLPLCDCREERTTQGRGYEITCLSGLCISEHAYYRSAVEGLGYEIKPFRYELEIEVHETDLRHLRNYLQKNFAPGEQVELWNLWLGTDEGKRPVRYAGSLTDFDMDTLEQFLKQPMNEENPGQCRMTMTI